MQNLLQWDLETAISTISLQLSMAIHKALRSSKAPSPKYPAKIGKLRARRSVILGVPAQVVDQKCDPPLLLPWPVTNCQRPAIIRGNDFRIGHFDPSRVRFAATFRYDWSRCAMASRSLRNSSSVSAILARANSSSSKPWTMWQAPSRQVTGYENMIPGSMP